MATEFPIEYATGYATKNKNYIAVPKDTDETEILAEVDNIDGGLYLFIFDNSIHDVEHQKAIFAWKYNDDDTVQAAIDYAAFVVLRKMPSRNPNVNLETAYRVVGNEIDEHCYEQGYCQLAYSEDSDIDGNVLGINYAAMEEFDSGNGTMTNAGRSFQATLDTFYY